jgi:hypothetical protein
MTMAGPWYLERDGYEPFLRHTSLSESEYLDAINQLLALIPADEARAYGNQIMHAEGGLTAPFQLLPVPFTVLTKHPLKLFLSGYVPNYWILCEAVNLGRDLGGIWLRPKRFQEPSRYAMTCEPWTSM